MIILLDLNYTLVANSEQKTSPFLKQIEGESYRDWLVNLLKPYHIILLTARPAHYKDATLKSIQEKTCWQPQEAYFNEYRLPPPQAKERLLQDYVFPKHGNTGRSYFAIESNPRTRAMYGTYAIFSKKVTDSEQWDSLPLVD